MLGKEVTIKDFFDNEAHTYHIFVDKWTVDGDQKCFVNPDVIFCQTIGPTSSSWALAM